MSKNQPTNVADTFASARRAQAMTLRQMGAALGVSYQQIQHYETGVQEPDRARVAAWIESDTPWVRQLGLSVFGSQFGALIQAVLVQE